MQEHPEFLCAETDLSDAYQHASREEMLVKLFASDELHDFLPIFYSLYDGDAELFFRCGGADGRELDLPGEGCPSKLASLSSWVTPCLPACCSYCY
jgi:hypothetical protein